MQHGGLPADAEVTGHQGCPLIASVPWRPLVVRGRVPCALGTYLHLLRLPLVGHDLLHLCNVLLRTRISKEVRVIPVDVQDVMRQVLVHVLRHIALHQVVAPQNVHRDAVAAAQFEDHARRHTHLPPADAALGVLVPIRVLCGLGVQSRLDIVQVGLELLSGPQRATVFQCQLRKRVHDAVTYRVQALFRDAVGVVHCGEGPGHRMVERAVEHRFYARRAIWENLGILAAVLNFARGIVGHKILRSALEDDGLPLILALDAGEPLLCSPLHVGPLRGFARGGWVAQLPKVCGAGGEPVVLDKIAAVLALYVRPRGEMD